MRLVIDANMLFSGILRKSFARKIVTDSRLELYAPNFLVTELVKYSGELKKKSRLGNEAFLGVTNKLVSRINFVNNHDIGVFYNAAKSLVSDKKDTSYAACALAVDAGIWSNDKHFETNRIRVWRTKELVNELFGKEC